MDYMIINENFNTSTLSRIYIVTDFGEVEAAERRWPKLHVVNRSYQLDEFFSILL